jgi:hypothetical protein
VSKTNDDLYDLLIQVDRKVDTYIASTDVRLSQLEARAGRSWQIRLLVLGAVLSPVVGLLTASKGG